MSTSCSGEQIVPKLGPAALLLHRLPTSFFLRADPGEEHCDAFEGPQASGFPMLQRNADQSASSVFEVLRDRVATQPDSNVPAADSGAGREGPGARPDRTVSKASSGSAACSAYRITRSSGETPVPLAACVPNSKVAPPTTNGRGEALETPDYHMLRELDRCWESALARLPTSSPFAPSVNEVHRPGGDALVSFKLHSTTRTNDGSGDTLSAVGWRDRRFYGDSLAAITAMAGPGGFWFGAGAQSSWFAGVPSAEQIPGADGGP
ncbi:hypothetical protein GQR58_029675 [Nymphon striatum]|nr:hypothetical protein GQR58_029675 [Nymphon striatum]